MNPTPTAYRFRVEATRSGYSAYSDELGVYSVGATLDALYVNLREALELHLEDADEQAPPLPIELILERLPDAAA